MIRHEEIRDLVVEWGLREDIVEKDYVIGWLLWGIGSQPGISETWAFKGGTCLRKCYFETYRFSEDLDFTVLPGGPVEPEAVAPVISDMLGRVEEASGVNFHVRPPAFRARGTPLSTEGSVYYVGPRGSPSPGRVKLDLLGSEKVVRPVVLTRIAHPYSDGLPAPGDICCYCLEELFGEKTRALGERSRPRDLYDVVNLYRRDDLRGEPDALRQILREKCASKGVDVPSYAAVSSAPNRGELESEWENMLGHQLPMLPPVETFLAELVEFFRWLDGTVVPRRMASVAHGVSEDRSWVPPATASSWGLAVPIESIRYAAVNRLCVELGYKGTRRLVEPYSLRRSKDGNLLLYAVHAHGKEVRCYRVDRIESIRVTGQGFTPVYAVEFTAYGPIQAVPMTKSVSAWPSPAHRPRRPTAGPTYVVECTYCRRRFTRKQSGATLRRHKDGHGNDCPGRTGFIVDTRWS